MRFHSALLLAAFAPFSTLAAQESKALFDSPVIVLDPWSRMETLVDADLDGDLDAVGGWLQQLSQLNTDIKVFLNDGNGDFTTDEWVIATEPIGWHGWNEHVIATGDWTGDGAADIAVAGPNSLIVWKVNSGAPPTEIDRQTTTWDPIKIMGVDIDGDPYRDIAVLTTTTGLELYRSNGTSVVHAGTFGGTFTHMVDVDMTGDSIPDLALVDATNDTLQCVHWNGTGLVDAGAFATAVTDPHPTRADIDGDGDVDIVMFGTGGYVVMRRTGSATFDIEPLATGGPATGLADIDGDGDPDGVCCGGGGPTLSPANISAVAFEISLNDGSGSFSPAWAIPNVGARHLAGAADIDADGDVDLVAGRGIYYAQEDWYTREPMPELRGALGHWTRMADLDGDGDPDYDITLADMGRNRGDGTEEIVPHVYEAPPPGRWYGGPGYVGDFDGDGDGDLVVGLEVTAGGFDGMALLRNQGGGSFEYAGLAGPPGTAFHPTHPWLAPVHGGGPDKVLDVDGDGDLDIAAIFLMTFNPMARTQIWLNDGQGSFAAGPLLQDYMVLAAEDFDGDSIPDLLVTHVYGYYSILQGAPGPSWAPSATMTWNENSEWFTKWAIEDIDGDGDVDIAGDNSDVPILYRNSGSGQFTLEQPLGAGDWIAWASGNTRHFLADLDDDGRKDWLAFAGEYSSHSTALVMLQNSDTSFTLATTQSMIPFGVADADGDGDIDVIGDRLVRSRLRTPNNGGGLRLQFGSGTPGQGGVVPTMGETGPFYTGAISTSTITGAVGGTPAVYVYGVTQAELVDLPFPGITMYAWPPIAAVPITMGGAPGATGAGSLDVTYVVPAGFAGLTLYKQVFLLDFAAPFGLTQTNGVAVSY